MDSKKLLKIACLHCIALVLEFFAVARSETRYVKYDGSVYSSKQSEKQVKKYKK